MIINEKTERIEHKIEQRIKQEEGNIELTLKKETKCERKMVT